MEGKSRVRHGMEWVDGGYAEVGAEGIQWGNLVTGVFAAMESAGYASDGKWL